MADQTPWRELQREDIQAALTKLLRHGYGLLTVKIHGHRIAALETTTRQTRIGLACEASGAGTRRPILGG